MIACVNAGGPAAYSISVPAIDHASAGQTQEHTVKVCTHNAMDFLKLPYFNVLFNLQGHYGQSSQSDYSSQVNTAHSSSHVSRSSITNDVAAHGLFISFLVNLLLMSSKDGSWNWLIAMF